MWNKKAAQKLDAEDVLKDFRKEFNFPLRKNKKPYLYFCGNSLGLQPKNVKKYLLQELEDWKNLAVEGHFQAKTPWYSYHESFSKPLADLVGAKVMEVGVMNSLTVNLHLLLVSFYQPSKTRYKILVEKGAFPSDRYALYSHAKFHSKYLNYDPASSLIEMEPRKGESYIRTEDFLKKIEDEGDSIALILLGDVNFLTGQAFDLSSIARVAQKKRCIFGVDLAHGIGNLLLNLHNSQVDFAVWCSYKYLNAGPGAIAGFFVHEKHSKSFDLPRFCGWWGHNKHKRFDLDTSFQGMEGAEGWQVSNPPIFQLASLRASLDIFEKATQKRLREKSIKLTAFLEEGLLRNPKIKILTPRHSQERGAQLSFEIKHSKKDLMEKIKKSGMLCDFRSPNIFRMAPTPLYNSFQDIYHGVNILEKLV